MSGNSESMKTYLTTHKAAVELGISARRVRALIEAGRLPAVRFGNLWVIEARHLAKVNERPTGRPRKTQSSRRRG